MNKSIKANIDKTREKYKDQLHHEQDYYENNVGELGRTRLVRLHVSYELSMLSIVNKSFPT